MVYMCIYRVYIYEYISTCILALHAAVKLDYSIQCWEKSSLSPPIGPLAPGPAQQTILLSTAREQLGFIAFADCMASVVCASCRG